MAIVEGNVQGRLLESILSKNEFNLLFIFLLFVENLLKKLVMGCHLMQKSGLVREDVQAEDLNKVVTLVFQGVSFPVLNLVQNSPMEIGEAELNQKFILDLKSVVFN